MDLSSDGMGGYTVVDGVVVVAEGRAQSDDQMGKSGSKEEIEAAGLKAVAALRNRERGSAFSYDEDSPAYDALVKGMEKEIQQLSVVLLNAEAKEKEREWLANQAQGDLDDRRLVDGMLGESHVYKRRGDPEARAGIRQKYPKRLRFVLDTSASMARFNNWDGRLDRLVATMVMVMESMSGMEHKYEVSMVGHSGGSPSIPIMDWGAIPRTPAGRHKVVESLYAASGSAPRGDQTLNALRLAVEDVVSAEADEYIVCLVSDANLGAYNITPESIREEMERDERVRVLCIFLAEESIASWLSASLVGSAWVCSHASDLPGLMREALLVSHS